MWIFYFVLLLGGLIFFHELGHFLVGKLMGVRVLTFAIGFGPSIPGLRWKRGETEYSINIFPLGGYVRFHGDEPGEELPEEDRHGSFNHAPLWRRFLIVLAGPVFNLVLPFIIFFLVFLLQADAHPPVLGQVVDGGPAAQGGLRNGDEVVRIDDEEVRTWWEMENIIKYRAGETLRFTVSRHGEEAGPFEVVPESFVRRRIPELDWVERYGRIAVIGEYPAPIVAVDPDSAAARAGLATWDRFVAIDGVGVGAASYDDVQRTLAKHAGGAVRVTVHRRLPGAKPFRAWWNPVFVDLPVELDAAGGVAGLAFPDTVVAEVAPDSPAAYPIGFLPGDRILSVDGDPCHSWTILRAKLEADLDGTHTLTFRRGALYRWIAAMPASVDRLLQRTMGDIWRVARSSVDPAAVEVTRSFVLGKEKGGGAHPRRIFGAVNYVRYHPPDPVPLPGRFGYAVSRCLQETLYAYEITILTVAGLLRGRVPMKDLGGPILIAELASRTAKEGWGWFFRLMVWLSINLGILNLLPIPILDGGHLMFFTIEAIKRKPLSLRARQLASYVGLAMIVLLMIIVFKNDIERNWSSIVSGLGCHTSF